MIEDLEKKYLQIPQEIKQTKRWICYKIEERDGKQTKVPYNAINGLWAKSNDSSTWTSFKVAILGCEKYKFDGIGFMLGEDKTTNTCYFGIDLDNHPDQNGEKAMSAEEFKTFCNEFIDNLKSYTEYSHSGEGIHIICKGRLPEGARRKAGVAVEMYERGRFFTMTGNVVNNLPINERTEEIKPLWEKYLNTVEEDPDANFTGIVFGANKVARTVEIAPSNLSDSELINVISKSKGGAEFDALFRGDMSAYKNDHSGADMALCKILAFWTGCNTIQMDSIFRRSGLMRPKWDQKRSETTRHHVPLSAGTYGSQTIEYAIYDQRNVYTPTKEKIVVVSEEKTQQTTQQTKTEKELAKETTIESPTEMVRFDEKSDPIVNVKKIFKHYPLNDTGNAERFYDYFGEFFKYNKTDKVFMFWNGKTWLSDAKDYVRKYANKLIDVLKSEAKTTELEIIEAKKQGDSGSEKVSELQEILKAQRKNIDKISNKSGKDNMLNELQSLHDIPVVSKEFDTYEWYLNTDSGVCDLRNGNILPFDKNYKLSKNTNCKVSFEEPKVFMKFLNDIFERPNAEETKEIIETVQMALGESATGRTNKDKLYIMHGQGSNGKSTFIQTINNVFGDYGTTMNSEMLIQNNSSSQSNEFSMSALRGARMVSTSETAEGKRLDEVTIKRMLSGEKINAQEKYGKPYNFLPTFSPWMSTNNKPIIRATDFGTWRRIYYIPFLNTFTDDKKDVDMPKKLAAEMPQILGWIIKGAVKLHNEYNDKLPKPKCLEEALSDYKKELDVIVAFIQAKCRPFPDKVVEATKLYRVYKEWCKDNNEYLFSESRFKLEMPKKGYPLHKDLNRGWVYTGIELYEDAQGILFGV